MRSLLSILFLVVTLLSLPLATYGETFYSSANFSVDLLGDPDTRPGTWGTAGVARWHVTFFPPAACLVEIHQVYGDLVAWPKGKVEEGRFAGVLFGLQTTGPEGSERGDWMADNCFLYVQDAVSQEPRRAAFSQRMRVRLLPDNKLAVTVAVWLNDTGREIHVEPTFVLGYRFVEQDGKPCPPRYGRRPAQIERMDIDER